MKEMMMNSINEIKHLIQPCGTSCVSTCIAMATGIPLDVVMDEFHKKYINNMTVNISDYLKKKGFQVKRFHTEDRMVFSRSLDYGIYFMAVPSLNLVGKTHEILLVWDEVEWTILDPNKGRVADSGEHAKYYVHPDKQLEENEHHLDCWAVDCMIKFNSKGADD